MSKNKRDNDRELPENYVVISYAKLGTVHPQELAQALIADINTLGDQCGAFFLTGAELTLRVTNEWGDPVALRKETGQRLKRFDTNHYVPACRDYEL